MTGTSEAIRAGSQVTLHLSIHLQDGTEALSTFGEEPLEVTIGDGTLAPGLEPLLVGLQAGARKDFTADGSDLYGERVEEKIHWLPVADFPADLKPERGQVVAFATPDGQETAGLVLAAGGARLQVDFNHPLAGRRLRIQIEVVAVDAPREET
jgi:FKBP-type peptidyl-prolyl cis-trans isomerase SlpA